MPLHFDTENEQKAPQELSSLGIDDVCLLDTLANFDLFGAWRLDVEDGLAYWSDDVFKIHGLPGNSGQPVNFSAALDTYHPDDQPHVIACLDAAVKHKSGCRFILRLKNENENEEAQLVKLTARFRVNAQGREELYGTCSRVDLHPVRSVMIGKSQR